MNTPFTARSSLFSFDTVVVPHTEFFFVLPTATPTFCWGSQIPHLRLGQCSNRHPGAVKMI